jgi:hypothetical protein
VLLLAEAARAIRAGFDEERANLIIAGLSISPSAERGIVYVCPACGNAEMEIRAFVDLNALTFDDICDLGGGEYLCGCSMTGHDYAAAIDVASGRCIDHIGKAPTDSRGAPCECFGCTHASTIAAHLRGEIADVSAAIAALSAGEVVP